MGSTNLDTNQGTGQEIMDFKILFVLTVCLIGLSLAVPMPWYQGDLEGVQGRSIDIENPVTANENDPHAYFLWKVPMTCVTFVLLELVVGFAKRNLLNKEYMDSKLTNKQTNK